MRIGIKLQNGIGTPAPSRRLGGQSLVEFAIVLPLLLLLVFAIMDFGRLFFTQETLQHAVREAGRFAVTGRQLADPDGNGGQLSRQSSIISTLRKAAIGLPIESENIQITDGGSGGTVRIEVTYEMKLITPIIGQFFEDGRYKFTVATAFKNEPF